MTVPGGESSRRPATRSRLWRNTIEDGRSYGRLTLTRSSLTLTASDVSTWQPQAGSLLDAYMETVLTVTGSCSSLSTPRASAPHVTFPGSSLLRKRQRQRFTLKARRQLRASGSCSSRNVTHRGSCSLFSCQRARLMLTGRQSLRLRAAAPYVTLPELQPVPYVAA